MSKRNPFRVIEKIGDIALLGVIAASVGLVLWAVVIACIREGWGLWTLLLIPGIPIGLFALIVIAGLISALTQTVGNRWQTAKVRWDNRHREVEPDSGEAD